MGVQLLGAYLNGFQGGCAGGYCEISVKSSTWNTNGRTSEIGELHTYNIGLFVWLLNLIIIFVSF